MRARASFAGGNRTNSDPGEGMPEVRRAMTTRDYCLNSSEASSIVG